MQERSIRDVSESSEPTISENVEEFGYWIAV